MSNSEHPTSAFTVISLPSRFITVMSARDGELSRAGAAVTRPTEQATTASMVCNDRISSQTRHWEKVDPFPEDSINVQYASQLYVPMASAGCTCSNQFAILIGFDWHWLVLIGSDWHSHEALKCRTPVLIGKIFDATRRGSTDFTALSREMNRIAILMQFWEAKVPLFLVPLQSRNPEITTFSRNAMNGKDNSHGCVEPLKSKCELIAWKWGLDFFLLSSRPFGYSEPPIRHGGMRMLWATACCMSNADDKRGKSSPKCLPIDRIHRLCFESKHAQMRPFCSSAPIFVTLVTQFDTIAGMRIERRMHHRPPVIP